MLYRVWPAVLGLALPWPQSCSYGGDDGHAGASGSNVAGHAGAIGGSAGRGAAGSPGGLGGGGNASAGTSNGGAGTSYGGAGTSNGGAGTSNGGAGTSNGGAGTSNGGAGTSNGGAGTSNGGAGTSNGGAGTSNGGADGGGAAGSGGGLQGSFTLSNTSLSISGYCEYDPQTLTITNTSSLPLAWHVADNDTHITFTPPSSTLEPGQGIAVSVLPHFEVPHTTSASIVADIAPTQMIRIMANLGAQHHFPVQPDIDFGSVRIVPEYTTPTAPEYNRTIAAAGSYVNGEVLYSDNPTVFKLDHASAAPFGNWPLTFAPTTVGPHEATFTFASMFGSLCPPNTFKARGVGVAP